MNTWVIAQYMYVYLITMACVYCHAAVILKQTGLNWFLKKCVLLCIFVTAWFIFLFYSWLFHLWCWSTHTSVINFFYDITTAWLEKRVTYVHVPSKHYKQTVLLVSLSNRCYNISTLILSTTFLYEAEWCKKAGIILQQKSLLNHMAVSFVWKHDRHC